jgi:hypothetical protein
MLRTGEPVGIYSAPLKQVVQKLPPTSKSDSAKFDLTSGDLMSTKTVVRTEYLENHVLIESLFQNSAHMVCFWEIYI